MNKQLEITDVFFDLDHTLWDFERNSELTYHKIFKKYNLQIHLPDFLKVYVPNNTRLWGLYQLDKIGKEELRYQRLKMSFDQIGVSVTDQDIDVLADDYIKYLSTFNHLFEHAETILDYLKPKYKLHIITNGFAEVQEGKLKNSSINHYFEVIMDSEKAGFKKPNPVIFEKAMSLANVQPEKALMVGDNYEVDILGAKNVGMHTLYFNPLIPKNDKSTIEIQGLIQIKNYL
jgi:putative hydrolase of the HAD superfamily